MVLITLLIMWKTFERQVSFFSDGQERLPAFYSNRMNIDKIPENLNSVMLKSGLFA